MRFLLGLILGAGAVLLLAEAVTGEVVWRDRLAAAVAGVERWMADPPSPPADPHRFAEDAGADDPLAGGPGAAVPVAGEPDFTDTVARADAAGRAAEDAAAGNVAGYPGTTPPAAAPASDPPAALAADPEPGPRPVADLEPALQPIPRPPDPQPVDALAVDASQAQAQRAAPERAPAQPGGTDLHSASVWVPFHSEMSASGFASRLSESVDHPFRVERRGPGRYQVVFRYHDEPERQALLAQAAEATGLPL